MMRVLLASDHYPPFVGGAQRQTQLLAQQLHARGHEVRVATVWNDELPDRSQDGAVPVIRLRQLRTLPVVKGRPRRRHQPPFPDPVTVVELRRLVREFRPDVVHVAGWMAFSASAALAGTDVPLVYSARDYGFTCATATLLNRGRACSGPALGKCLACAGEYYGRPRGWIAVGGVAASAPLLRRRATGIHAVSSYVAEIAERDLYRGVGGPAVAPAVIGSFRVDEPEEEVAAAELPAALPDEPFILFVGALRRVKGLAVLFDAYRRLESPPPLVLIGTLERDTPTDVPDGAVILSQLPHAAVLRAWDRSLFGVMPSLWPEPFGSVVHEAMSRGRPVIGTTPGGHADMITDGETGFLVPAGDVDALTAAMRRLLDDPQLCADMGERARDASAAFDAADAIPRFERLYRDAVAAAGAHG